MTYDQAVEVLREKGWCCTPAHPNSAFKYFQCGPRGSSECYGPFPGGWVEAVYGTGDTLIEAVEYAIRFARQKEAKELADAIEADIDHAEHGL